MYTPNTKYKQKKTALANRTIYTLIWYTFYDLRPGNGVSPILTTPEPTRGQCPRIISLLQLYVNVRTPAYSKY